VKLYYFPIAPNPTRVRVYIREKGIALEQEEVNLVQGEQKSAAHLERNPKGALPVLELDDGECITESLTIMEYLEELYPEPVMIGDNPLARARIREYERIVETNILHRVGRIIHSTNSPLGRPPIPEVANAERDALPAGLALANERIGKQTFAAGETPTIVDCTLFAALYFAEFFSVEIGEQYENLQRWYAAFKQRPSAQP
jgi:glutathione S-transferase